MSGLRDGKKAAERLKDFLGKYQYVLLVILAGVILLLLPKLGATREAGPAGGEECGGSGFDIERTEERLAEILSEVEGAGRVRVLLSVKGGARQVIAQNGKTSERESSTSAVIVSRGSGLEEPVLLQEIYPQYQGALIVCPGGDDPRVQFKLVQAVSALTGLGADKISICKSK